MKLTIWLKGANSTLFVGGDPTKSQAPIVTAELVKPQLLIDPDKSTVTIIETK